MKTLEIEIALMRKLNYVENIIVPNVSFGMMRYFFEDRERKCDELHECDILKLSKSGYATEYEIKISKSDFMSDFKKKHNHSSKFIKQMYYAVPIEMLDFAKDNLPENCGLVCYNGKTIIEIKKAPIRKCFKWTDVETLKLAKLGAMRIYNLKKNLLKYNQK